MSRILVVASEHLPTRYVKFFIKKFEAEHAKDYLALGRWIKKEGLPSCVILPYMPDKHLDETLLLEHGLASKGIFVGKGQRARDRVISTGMSWFNADIKKEQVDRVLDTIRSKIQSAKTASIIGNSDGIRRLRSNLIRASNHALPVVLVGKTGTGKNMSAEFIHNHSSRKDKPFRTINCSALQDTLLSSELFGHEKGAFTGAVTSSKGQLRSANGGTVLLDEVQCMSEAAQIKLLNFLESQTVTPVGGHQEYTVDVRIICAFNEPIETLLRKNYLREDFYYRIAVSVCHLPSLNSIREDIPLIANALLKDALVAINRKGTAFTKSALDALKKHSYKGNVRELRNIVTSAAIAAKNKKITETEIDYAIGLLPKHRLVQSPGKMKKETTFTFDHELYPLSTIEREYLKHAYNRYGSWKKACRALGISSKRAKAIMSN